jgi:hypothetical protein
LSFGTIQQKGAGLVDAYAIHSLKGQPDRRSVSSRSDLKVILELALIAVIDHVHAGVDLVVSDARELWDISLPIPWVGATDVVALARQLIETCDLGFATCAFELHAHN